MIQQLPPEFAINILKKIIRYHILLRWLLYRAPLQDFDPVLNEQLLRSYMSDLFEFGDHLSHRGEHLDEFEAYRILLNFNDESFIVRSMAEYSFSRSVFRINAPTSRCEHACAVYLSLNKNNYRRFFRMCEQGFNFLESCCLLEMFTVLRVEFLNRLCTAFNNKQLKFNMDSFAKWLSFDSATQAILFVEHFNLTTDGCGKNIIFHPKQMFAIQSTVERLDLVKQSTYRVLIDEKKDGPFTRIVDRCKCLLLGFMQLLRTTIRFITKVCFLC